jgi:hypothetical protein
MQIWLIGAGVPVLPGYPVTAREVRPCGSAEGIRFGVAEILVVAEAEEAGPSAEVGGSSAGLIGWPANRQRWRQLLDRAG